MTATLVRTQLGLIAHRGASGYAPENTLASFSKCLEMGARAIEFDVQQTKDNRLVIIHDLHLNRLAASRKSVKALAYPELAGFDVGRWFDARFAGESVPLLEQLFDLCEKKAPGQVELHLEIKSGRVPYAGIEKRVLDLLASRPEWKGRVVVSSFDHEVLRRVRSLSSKMRLGYLAGSIERRPAAIRDAEILRCESVNLSERKVDLAWVAAARQARMKTLVYTVNSSEACRRLAAMGVDAVFTNFPDVLEKES